MAKTHGLRLGRIMYTTADRIQIDQKWRRPVQKKQRTLAEEIHLAVLKANRLGASGFKVTSLKFDHSDIVLGSEPYSQAELNEIALKRDMALSEHKSNMIEGVLRARTSKSIKDEGEDLTPHELENVIATYESQKTLS